MDIQSLLDEIVRRAMMRDPVDRYRKASDFEVALLNFLRSSDYAEFAQQESTLPAFTKPVDWSDESSKSTISPYSSAKSMADVAIADAPTLQVRADENTRNPTEMVKVADPTITRRSPVARIRRFHRAEKETRLLPLIRADKGARDRGRGRRTPRRDRGRVDSPRPHARA